MLEMSSSPCLQKVISGGQIGADLAGLEAAVLAGLETGGTAPLGYRTQNGPNLELKTLYELSEDSSYNYKPRTVKNVVDSDGTIIIAKNLASSGCTLTSKTATRKKKPLLQISVPDRKLTIDELEHHIESVVQFLNYYCITTVNIAGNRDHVKCDYPLAAHCKLILVPAFERCKYDKS